MRVLLNRKTQQVNRDQQHTTSDTSAQQIPQSHANPTRTIFIDESPTGLLVVQDHKLAVYHRAMRSDECGRTPKKVAVLPPFGTMLPFERRE